MKYDAKKVVKLNELLLGLNVCDESARALNQSKYCIFQFKIQRRSRFRLHPGISSDTRGTNGHSAQTTKASATGSTGVLQFHGWEKGSPIIANNLSEDEDEPPSGKFYQFDRI